MGARYVGLGLPVNENFVEDYYLVVGNGYFAQRPRIDKQAFYNAAYGPNWREVVTADKVDKRKTLLLELLTCTGIGAVMGGLIVLGMQFFK